ncbi:hypothetical protein [Rhodococcus sp. IEGM 1379]|uniref:hypothetical protein n=1 Tax=Rhodococcus sp. IEGM 1379 TaxID=3047086 RepID=UPI0024B65F31|nr:hypothetical protein [Rhodococcus sp. IEGM 1379]MDI9917866.1 hypothetical protein [Rhodococcus sp. IEGM 1379]
MARKRHTAVESGVRNFTSAELDRIRELTSEPLPRLRLHPHPVSSELDRIHEAAGRRRSTMIWELGGGEHDPRAAFEEETG